MKTIQIEEPDRELTEGLFTLIVKYFVLFIVSYMAGMLLFIFYPRHVSAKKNLNFIENHPEIVSYFVIICVFYFYSNRLYQKYKYGLITTYVFNEQNELHQVNLLNTFNGKNKTVTFSHDTLEIKLHIKENILFGKQRVLSFYQLDTSSQKKLISILNIDLTAWTRHPELEQLLTDLKVEQL